MSPELIISLISLLIAVIALIVSIIALVYTAKTYWLKVGANIRVSFSMCTSSVACEDQYVTSLTLENLKDRAIAIFKIYLKVGQNYFVQLEDFSENPFILRPFEVYNKEYDPIDLYSVSLRRIDLNDLLSNSKIKKQIVLSTPDGKYLVKESIKRWSPVYDFFQNHLTATIIPRRTTFKGKSYGINAKYVVEIKAENGREEIIPIYPQDYEIQKFNNFRLTKDALDSKAALEEFLYDQIGNGLLNCAEIEIYDMKTWLDKVYSAEYSESIKAKYYNSFIYNVLGPIITKISDISLLLKNRRQRKAAIRARKKQ